MKITLGQDSLTSDEQKKMILLFARDMLVEYHIKPTQSNIFQIVGHTETKEKLCEWVMKKYNITMTPWVLGQVGHGFEIVEDADLTKHLLTTDLTKKIKL
jgi:hypothetical protein